MSSVPPFHQRFNIAVDYDEAKKRFINRFINFFSKVILDYDNVSYSKRIEIMNNSRQQVAFNLGKDWNNNKSLEELIEMEFNKTLQAIEAVYSSLDSMYFLQNQFSAGIQNIVSMSEYDLGVKWEEDHFKRTGAKILDDALVNDSLKWLQEKGLKNILIPFNKALLHYSESIRHPEKLKDVLTDMYESLEAAAKWVTGRDKDLSANAELLISKLKLSEHHKTMLDGYIKYANQFRHGTGAMRSSPSIDKAEAENFIYLTGVFIRFAIEKKSVDDAPVKMKDSMGN
ncbi:MAG: hypothetical protein ACYDBV_02990 [Nitrospiria bacterium]